MNSPKKFEEYIKEGIIRKASPDKSRASFLVTEAENSLEGLKERIEKIKIKETNSNSITKDCYDIIMEMIRAHLLLNGYISSGLYAHEAEVSYMEKIGFSENEISFMNELRYFRNGITYYGKILNKEYAEKVFDFLKKVYPRLKITKI